jgi:signal transduction histidine kinase
LPSANVNCLLEDSEGTVWAGTAAGVAFRASGSFQHAARAPAKLQQPVLGIAEDGRGSLWIATSTGILRVPRDRLLRGELTDTDVREYGLTDGLRGVEGVRRHQSVVKDSRGRIWFSMNRGISAVDPHRLAGDSPPALPDIQTITADGTPMDARERVRIPRGSKRLTIGYTSLILSVPDRVRFRYLLEGFDHGWSAPVAAREAVYTNLEPGDYRFRVMASNADGVWNGSDASLAFEIEPAFWQRWWFRAGALLAVALGVLMIYSMRLRQLTQRISIRFEERLAERTRIAQELHDTLLQGFLSASMQLHVAADRLPENSPAKPSMNRVLQLMSQVIEEGRNAVQGLRSTATAADDLEQAFSRIREELDVDEKVEFRLIVEGRSRALHPMIRDEVYRIGREALVNAFRHARARRIEVELDYAPGSFRLLVRDDGCGIDPVMVTEGREGHWGLRGMRERAERIGARLKVRSSASAGTEVELWAPGQVAFEARDATGPLGRFARLYARWLR